MTRVIAEAGMCGNDLDWAHRAVDAAADAGCWGFKVQMLNADTLTAVDAPRYARLPGGATQHDDFQNALPYEAWGEVFTHARERHLIPFASAWDEAAVERLVDLDAAFIKVGSADLTHHRLLEVIADTKLGVFLSTGAALPHEIMEAAFVLAGDAWESLVVPMACVLSYPAPRPGFHKISLLHQFGFDTVGYSDHTTSLTAGYEATIAGASYVEKHFTVTPGEGGDHDFALDPDELAEYVEACSWLLAEEIDARFLARRGLHTTRPVPRGTALVVGVNCRFVRPWNAGIPADDPGPWVSAVDLVDGQLVMEEHVTRDGVAWG